MCTKEIHVGVVGSAGVGKTALIQKFVTGEFSQEYTPTKSDVSRKEITVEGKTIILEIHDLGGGPGNDTEMEEMIKKVDAFIIVYDITNPASLDAVQDIKSHILKEKKDCSNLPIVLTGGKTDLNQSREVPGKKGVELSRAMNCVFLETSAMSGDNVDALFTALVTKSKSCCEENKTCKGKCKCQDKSCMCQEKRKKRCPFCC